MVLRDQEETQEFQVTVENQENKDHQEKMGAMEIQDQLVKKENVALLVHQDLKDAEDHLDLLETVESLVNQERLDPRDSQDWPDVQDHTENVENKVLPVWTVCEVSVEEMLSMANQELTELMVLKDKSDNKDTKEAVDLVEIWVNQDRLEMLETMVRLDLLALKAPPEVMVPVD